MFKFYEIQISQQDLVGFYIIIFRRVGKLISKKYEKKLFRIPSEVYLEFQNRRQEIIRYKYCVIILVVNVMTSAACYPIFSEKTTAAITKKLTNYPTESVYYESSRKLPPSETWAN